MPTHTPSFPDLLFDDAARLRRWEAQLMGHLDGPATGSCTPAWSCATPTNPTTVRFFDGDQLVALRWDFTEALARTLVRRFQEPPRRLSYAGPVFRRPANSWDPVERLEVGCEHIQTDPDQRLRGGPGAGRPAHGGAGPAGAGGLPAAHRPRGPAAPAHGGGGHPGRTGPGSGPGAGPARHPPGRGAAGGHPAKDRLLAHAEILLSGPNGPGSLDDLARGPYGALLEAETGHLRRVLERLFPAHLPEGLTLRLDLGDLRGLAFYTGPTLRLWAPGAQRELAAGGRYDGLYPELGRPWYAAGFCVRLTTLLELGEPIVSMSRVSPEGIPRRRPSHETTAHRPAQGPPGGGAAAPAQGQRLRAGRQGPQVPRACASPWPTPACPPSCSRGPTCPATWPGAWPPWASWARTSWTRPRWT